MEGYLKYLLILCFFITSCTSTSSDNLNKGGWTEDAPSVAVNNSSDDNLLDDSEEEDDEFGEVKIAEKIPKNYETLFLLLKGSDTSAIESEAKKLLFAKENDLIVLNSLSYYYRKINKYRLSELLANRVLSIDKTNLKGRYNLAMVYLKKKKENKALQEFLNITKINKENTNVTRNIAAIYLASGMELEALPYLETLYSKDKNDIQIAASLLEARISAKKFKLAESLSNKLIGIGQLVELSTQTNGKRILMSYLKMLEVESDIQAKEHVIRLKKMTLLDERNLSFRAKKIIKKIEQIEQQKLATSSAAPSVQQQMTDEGAGKNPATGVDVDNKEGAGVDPDLQ